jgi:hypothetical protein
LEQEHQIYWRAIALVLDKMKAQTKKSGFFDK